MKNNLSKQSVFDYYSNLESKWGYRLLLKGNRHFGYYPSKNTKISFSQAQILMEEQLAQKLFLPQASLLLDAGCGEGNTAIYLAQKYSYRIKGVDLLKDSIFIARKKAKAFHLEKHLIFMVGDYTQTDFPNNIFDGIYTMETLVHIKNYQRALRELFRILKPDGKIVLFEYTLSKQEDLNKIQKEIWKKVIEGTGMFGLPKFTHGLFPKILKEAGFIEVKVEEITERVMPMLDTFNKVAHIPYLIIKLLKQEKRFVNAMFSVEAYNDLKKNKTWKYVIVSARKPVI